jgi:replicative DNA helicase
MSLPTPTLRVPPASVDAERRVLGAVLIAPDAWIQVADRVDASAFYLYAHRLLYQAIEALAAINEPIDEITVAQRLRDEDHLDDVGGTDFLRALIKETPSAANITAYADIIAEHAALRGIIHAGTKIAQSATLAETDAETAIEQAEGLLNALRHQGQRRENGLRHVRSAAREAFRLLEARWNHRDQPQGAMTGLTELDALLVGLQPGDLVIVAARPGMGKSALALTIALHVAEQQGKSAGIFTLEMSAVQLVQRALSSMASIDSKRLRSGALEDDDWYRYGLALARAEKIPILFDDSPALTPGGLRSRALRMDREQRLGLIVVDYLQLMDVPGSKENLAVTTGEISRSLKALARELEVPVIALSQLNRSLETRQDKRPVLADLRNSGAIEQDADVVLFIYRDAYYNESAPAEEAEIIVAKARNGPTGTAKVRFVGPYTRFENLPIPAFPDGLD